MWSSINKKASEVLSVCEIFLELAKDKVTKIIGDYKENMSVLTSITMVNRPSISDDSPWSDNAPMAAKTATKSELYEATAEKYDKVIELTKENIEYGIKGLEDIERRMRLEKATSFLFEGGKICKEIIFCFHNEDDGRKGVCVRLGGVYATAFACGEDRESLFYIDRSYPLVAKPATFVTGIELASDKNNHDADLIVEHFNYAVMELGKIKVYEDDIEEVNQLFETDSLTDRLSKTGINDLKEHSNVFDVQVFSSEGRGPMLSITIDNCPAVYESRPLFEYMGQTSTTTTVERAASIDEDGDEEDEGGDELSRHKPTYYIPSDDMATRAADYMMSEKFNYTRDMHEILVRTRENTPRLVPLEIKHASSNVSAAAATNPLLDGMADCVNDGRIIAIFNLESDIQDSITRSFASLKPKKLNGYDALVNLIDDNCTDELDVAVSKRLLEEEEYASRLALHTTKDMFESLKFLGGLGLDPSVLQQREAIEGMRSERDYCSERMRHCNTGCLKREELAEAIKDWICTQYGSTLSQSDSRTIKTKNFSYTVQPCKKRSRPSSDNEKSRKRCKNEDGSPSNIGEEEENDKEATCKIQIKKNGTVIPPVMFSEPREASSGNVMSEVIGEYASVIAKHVAESPNGSVRLASAIRLLLSLKKRLATKITRLSDKITLIQPIEPPRGNDGASSSSAAAGSLCEALFARSERAFAEREATEDVGIVRLLERAHIKLDLEDEEKKKLADRMKGLLNMRRCCEERAAYKHLMGVSILEKMVGIVSGEGTIYSLPLRNAVKWYARVVIRNRVCDLIDVMNPESAEFVPELVRQVICSLDWFLKFDINYKYLLDRKIISPTEFEGVRISSPHSLYSPGTRHALLIDLKSGEDAFPVVATRLPSMTSMIRQVRIGDSFSLCINNYSTGKLFVFSTDGMKTRYRESKMTGGDMYSMMHLAPFRQLNRDERQSATVRDIVQHWDDYEMEHARNKTSFNRVILQKRGAYAEEVIKNGSVSMTVFVCNYREMWKNLFLFEPSRHIGYKFGTNGRARAMLSLSEQYALNTTLEGKSLPRYNKAVEKYIASFDRKKKSLTKIDLVVFCKDNGEELCRCEGSNDCMFRYKNDTIKSVVDVYEAKTMKNGGKLRRYIASGNTSAPTTITTGDDNETTEGEGGGAKEESSSSLIESESLEKNNNTDGEGTKKIKRKGVGSVIDKAPASPVIDTREGVHSTNMIPFMSKMYNVIRVNQKIREKCIFKKMELVNKK
uniref:Wsv151-like protein n=1 Tax=Hemigrapsus takanoi nimavirus TaxID=2133792 RepID=A0A401IP28_9VIRU|nr:MAG: wsv151-like protein [Hemigrapsus takanoi nimavirus]GBG35365.1 wsv151-like protein [Hemigrapsus takanoi nimavirus]